MRRRFLICVLASSLSFIQILTLAGCAKKAAVRSDASDEVTSSSGDSGSMDSDSGNALGLQTVHFEFDSHLLSREAKARLQTNSKILKNQPSLSIQVEGHCDSRGGIQYNLALGEKRAKAVWNYLKALGVKPNRIAIVSYGKERPLRSGNAESDHAANRRANFVITRH